MEHAERIGLPEPQHVTVDDTGYIAFGFARLADLTDWALWMEATLEERTLTSGQLHRSATGDALEQRIEVWHVTLSDELTGVAS
jgi:hypothetical protein